MFKIRKSESLVIAILVAMVLITGCKKPKDGVAGKDGNANVKAHTYSVTNWSSNSSRWYTQLSFPELTSDNINTSSVQVYWGTVSNNWVALPYTYVSTTDYFMGYITAPNIIEVRWDYNGIGIGSDPNTIFGSNVQIKAVVIPPAIIKENPDVDWKDYSAVKKRFNLKD